ncbi:MAG: AraC family transcriptional regulator [Actinomycetota bacterium]
MYLSSVFVRDEDPDQVTPAPPAEYHHLVWPLDHTATHVTAGHRSTLLLAPDALWVRAGTPIRVHGTASVGSAKFRASSCPSTWSRTAHLVLHSGVTALLEWLPAQSTQPWAADVLSAVVDQLAHAQLRAPVDLPLPADAGIRKVALELVADPSDQRSIGILAAAAGYVERTFRRRFAVETGLPFTTWRAELRIGSAVSMLRAGQPVETVARRCGYSSRAGFTRAFKAAVGIPPSQFARSSPTTVPDQQHEWPLRRGQIDECEAVPFPSIDFNGYSTRATSLAAAGMLLLATACSDADTDDSASTATTSPTAVDAAIASDSTSTAPPTASTTAPTSSEPTVPVDTIVTTTAAATEGVDDGCAEGARLFDDDRLLGDPVCIPTNPERIVPIGFAPVEVMLVTGTDFAVGSSAYSAFLDATHPEWVPAIEAATAGLGDAGAFQINIEAVAAAAPDLIVATGGFVAPEEMELLREIAPTVEFDSSETGADWRTEFRFVGDAMNVSDDIEALIADADRRLGELSAALGDSLDGQTVSVVRARPDNALQLRLAGSSAGITLEQLGIQRPPSQAAFANADGLFTEQLSQELWLDQADADVLFLYANQPGAGNEELLAAITGNPLWGQLDAVQNGRAYVVGGHWHSAGVLAEHKVIDDLWAFLADAPPSSPELAPSPSEG